MSACLIDRVFHVRRRSAPAALDSSSNDGSLDWLIESPESGATYHTDDVTALTQSMIELAYRGQDIMGESARARRAALASRFNYDAVIDAVLSRLLCQSQKQY